jgi:hypothetical protein
MAIAIAFAAFDIFEVFFSEAPVDAIGAVVLTFSAICYC